MFVFNDNRFDKFDTRIWLASPTMYSDSMKYAMEAYETNWMSTVGENIDMLEEGAKEKVGAKYAVALSTGTAALHMAMKIANVKHGDKVFCSDLTFAATVNPIVYEGAVPVFIDTEYDTWNMDPEALEKAFQIYPDVKVVVVVHLYGVPCKMDEIRKIAEKYNAIIIEDAAESFGASYKGKQTGILGNVGCISFNGNKIITGSSGGMLFTNDLETGKKVRKWSTQSRENASWYQHNEIGYNYRMSNLIAGVVRGQLSYLDKHIERKKEIYERYRDGFKKLPVIMNPYDEKNSEPNFWLSCLLINKDSMCEHVRGDEEVTYVSEHGKTCPSEILDSLIKFNIEGRPIWKPMHMQPVYANCPFVTRESKSNFEKEVNSFDVGNDIFQRGLCLPSDIKMTNEQQDIIIDIIKSCFD